jgi:ElaB/YqjD/DUF883 family membrane-anchored ribosome-binding protein
MSDADLRAEIEALRREIAGLYSARKTKIDAAEDAAESAVDNLMDQMRTLAQEISDFAEEAEKGVVNHPLTSVLGALVLGILIGRLLHR